MVITCESSPGVIQYWHVKTSDFWAVPLSSCTRECVCSCMCAHVCLSKRERFSFLLLAFFFLPLSAPPPPPPSPLPIFLSMPFIAHPLCPLIPAHFVSCSSSAFSLTPLVVSNIVCIWRKDISPSWPSFVSVSICDLSVNLFIKNCLSVCQSVCLCTNLSISQKGHFSLMVILLCTTLYSFVLFSSTVTVLKIL